MYNNTSSEFRLVMSGLDLKEKTDAEYYSATCGHTENTTRIINDNHEHILNATKTKNQATIDT